MTTGRESSDAGTVVVKPSVGYGVYLMRQSGAWRPPTDVYETDGYVVIQVEVAGMSGGDFDVTLSGKRLVISGKREDSSQKRSYHNMEIQYGAFRSEVLIGWSLNDAELDASYEDGFLQVRVPKAKRHRVVVHEAHS